MSSEKAFFKFRIFTGSLKGKLIKTPNLGVTRPPLSRLRKSIFDFLNPYLPESTYLDLFSGTGSYLFEAVSRGVNIAYGVEKDKILAASINEQAVKFGIKEKLYCLCQDVFETIPKLESQKMKFDLIMIAPPQYKGLINMTLEHLLKHRLLEKKGYILCQHDTTESKKINFLDYKIFQQRKYGNTTFTILTQD
ncbi:MAG: RsmD family RNA methyltransferase [Candidatus Zixiibacteriota bacterium]